MRLLVNALCVTNDSGRQVLCGLLGEYLRQTAEEHTLVLLLHPVNRDVADLLVEEMHEIKSVRVMTMVAPSWVRHWLVRALYERLALGRLAAKVRADKLLSFSGGWTPRIPCPQYTLALNPWAMVDAGVRSTAERFKAILQRRAYRQALKCADGIGYGSAYMRDCYRANAGGEHEKLGAIVYPALVRREIEAMDAIFRAPLERERDLILCVSRMAPHKDVETLVDAVYQVRTVLGFPARLRIVGGWSNRTYRESIESRIRDLALDGVVELTGHLPREPLRMAYRTAKVYCLLSRSESFGIPSIEAQRMGTPVVAASACAAPEVCGEGAWYVQAGDATGAAKRLYRLLTSEDAWKDLSEAARRNAVRFDYRMTVLPLLDMLGIKPKEFS